MKDDNPIVRYWAATGCLILEKNAAIAAGELEKLLKDDLIDTRIVAAESLCHLGKNKVAEPIYLQALKDENQMIRLHAINSLQAIHSFVDKIQMKEALNMMIAKNCKNMNQYDCRAVAYLIQTLNRNMLD